MVDYGSVWPPLDGSLLQAVCRAPSSHEGRTVYDAAKLSGPRCSARVTLNTTTEFSTKTPPKQIQEQEAAAVERLAMHALTHVTVRLYGDVLPTRLTVSLVADGTSYGPMLDTAAAAAAAAASASSAAVAMSAPAVFAERLRDGEYIVASRTWHPSLDAYGYDDSDDGTRRSEDGARRYTLWPLLDCSGDRPLALPLGLMWRTGIAVVVTTGGDPAVFSVCVEGFTRGDEFHPTKSPWRDSAGTIAFREGDVAPQTIGPARKLALLHNGYKPRDGWTNLWNILDGCGCLAFARDQWLVKNV